GDVRGEVARVAQLEVGRVQVRVQALVHRDGVCANRGGDVVLGTDDECGHLHTGPAGAEGPGCQRDRRPQLGTAVGGGQGTAAAHGVPHHGQTVLVDHVGHAAVLDQVVQGGLDLTATAVRLVEAGVGVDGEHHEALRGETVPVPGHRTLARGVTGCDDHTAVGSLTGVGRVVDGAPTEAARSERGDTFGGGVQVSAGRGDALLRRLRTTLVGVLCLDRCSGDAAGDHGDRKST